MYIIKGQRKNKIGYHDPLTKRKIYLNADEQPPEGFIKGLPPTTGKGVNTPHGSFNSVQECMRYFGITRYQIQQNINNSIEWSYI